MSYLSSTTLEQAGGKLKAIFETIIAARGGTLPRWARALGSKPSILESLFGMTRSLSADSTIGHRRHEMIATLVSSINGAPY